MIISSYLNRKNKQKLEDLVHSKFKSIIFYKKRFVENFFKDQDSSNFTGGTRQRGDWTASNTVLMLLSLLIKVH